MCMYVCYHSYHNLDFLVMNGISILFVSWRLASHVEVQGPLPPSFDVTQMQPPNGTRVLKGQKFSGNQSLGYRFTHPMAG